MANNLTLSAAGLETIKKHEASINGLYDDPAGYATYGVGHLVHPTHKSKSALLETARSDKLCVERVKTQWPGKSYATAYLEREAVGCKDFGKLKTNARDRALEIIAQSRHKKAYKQLTNAEKAAVNTAADAAVAEEARLLTFTVNAVLAQDVKPFEKAVNEVVTGVELGQDEFDALVSFAFNVGSGSFRRSTLLKKINENAYRSGSAAGRANAIEEIESAFLAWNKAGGKVLDGLTRRRQAEADLFLKKAREELKTVKATNTGVATRQGPTVVPRRLP